MNMIKSVKKALPLVVFIIQAAGALGLWAQLDSPAILVGGVGAALINALLFYAVICWDDDYAHKEKEKKQLSSVVDHAMDAIVICNADGRILYANPSADQAYGLRREDSEPASLAALGLDRAMRDQVVPQVLSGRAWNGEVTKTADDDTLLIHLLNIFRLEEFQGHEPALVSIGRDLTQRKALEQKLAHSQKLAAVGELAAGVSHEINNPMAAIQSQIGLARDLLTLQGQPSPEAHQDILDCIDETSHQIRRCSTIVQSLLRFSRQPEPDLHRFRLDHPIEQAVKFMQSLPSMKQVHITYDRGCGTLDMESDAGCITQILVNLLVNAGDAIDHQGRIGIRCRSSGEDHVAIEVIDRGCGISPERIDRVFEPFFTTKPPGKGTGLGLSISYGMAESLGGHLSLMCPSQGGTVATLTLPLWRASPVNALPD